MNGFEDLRTSNLIITCQCCIRHGMFVISFLTFPFIRVCLDKFVYFSKENIL